MDLAIGNLDDSVVQRLREQATAEGLTLERHVRRELNRIASRLSPDELVQSFTPMTQTEFEGIRQRMRGQSG